MGCSCLVNQVKGPNQVINSQVINKLNQVTKTFPDLNICSGELIPAILQVNGPKNLFSEFIRQ